MYVIINVILDRSDAILKRLQSLCIIFFAPFLDAWSVVDDMSQSKTAHLSTVLEFDARYQFVHCSLIRAEHAASIKVKGWAMVKDVLSKMFTRCLLVKKVTITFIRLVFQIYTYTEW